MLPRRLFLKQSNALLLASVTGALLSACGGGGGGGGRGGNAPAGGNGGGNNPAPPAATANWLMHDEGQSHKASWMAFGAATTIWGSLTGPAQDALARIAAAIVQFEPVNMLVRPQELALARQKLDPRIKLVTQDMDDLWLRDSGPVFVTANNGEQAGVNFNFNGWGNRQAHSKDSLLAAAVSAQCGVRLLSSSLVLEGGAIEVDGQGTAIITESSVLNANRNPGVSKAQCESELLRVLGIRKVIWLPGIAGRDITDGHVDFYARFVRPGVVVAGYEPDPTSYDNAVTRQNLAILRAARDVNGQPLQVVQIDAPSQVRPAYASSTFAAGYINYYLCNGGLILPEFGDTNADANAKNLLAGLFPGRSIVQVNIDAIAAGGGGIHCTIQQQPLV